MQRAAAATGRYLCPRKDHVSYRIHDTCTRTPDALDLASRARLVWRLAQFHAGACGVEPRAAPLQRSEIHSMNVSA